MGKTELRILENEKKGNYFIIRCAAALAKNSWQLLTFWKWQFLVQRSVFLIVFFSFFYLYFCVCVCVFIKTSVVIFHCVCEFVVLGVFSIFFCLFFFLFLGRPCHVCVRFVLSWVCVNGKTKTEFFDVDQDNDEDDDTLASAVAGVSINVVVDVIVSCQIFSLSSKTLRLHCNFREIARPLFLWRKNTS